MADKIRNTLEKFIPDLLALQKRNIFTPQEVKQILQNRERLEYLSNRKTVSLKDFLKVVEYEYQLERKRLQKCNELKIKKMGDRDYTIIKRIINLWDRIMNKYKYEVSLWKQYLAFSYQIESKKQFRKVVTHALRFNSHNIDLWVIAALYEFETQHNPFKARQIFYQALKINSSQSPLWAEYLRFELKFLVLVRERENIITGTQKQEESSKDFIRFEEEINHQKEDFVRITDFSIVKTILKLAIEKHDHPEMYKDLLTVLQEFDFIDKSLIQEFVSKGRLSVLSEKNKLLSQEEINKLCSIYIYFLESLGIEEEVENDLTEIVAKFDGKNQLEANLICSLLRKLPHSIEIKQLFKNNQMALFNEHIFSQLVNSPQQELLYKLFQSSNITIKERLCLYKYFPSFSTDVLKLMKADFEKIEKGLIKVKNDELLNYLIHLMKMEDFRRRTLQLAKKYLINDKSLFSNFLDAYFTLLSDEQERKELFDWLSKQNQYCPLKYHLMNTKMTFQRMSQLMIWFGDQKENWKIGFDWTKQNCPEKLVELMSFAEKNSTVQRSILQEYMISE